MIDTRFVILGYGRAGSTTFKDLLSQHPNVQAYGEVFRGEGSKERIGKDRLKVNGQSYYPGMEPVSFLEQTVFCAPNEFGKRCIGFKLFFYHARGDAKSYALWPHLIGQKDIKVIFLFRRNLFDSYVSQQRAQRSGQFGLVDDADKPSEAHKAPFEIDLKHCAKHLKTRALAKARLQEMFQEHQCLTLEYETLFAAPQETMADAFRFLGESPVEVTVKDEKLNRVPHKEGITNYSEVAAHFRRSLFEDYFAGDNLRQPENGAS